MRRKGSAFPRTDQGNVGFSSSAFLFLCFLRLFEAPCDLADLGFHHVFYLIGKVAEEVDVGHLFELVNADDARREVLFILIEGAVFEVEADGFVTAIDGTLVLAQDGHEEILWYAQARPSRLDDVRRMVDGSALDHIEGIAEALVVPRTDFHLKVRPDSSVEAVQLRLHIAVKEGLAVGFQRVPTVGTGADVTARVPRTAVETLIRPKLRRNICVLEEVIFSLHVASAIGCIPPERRPALGFLRDVPFDAEVHVTIAQPLDKEHIDDTAFKMRDFQTSGIGSGGNEVRVRVCVRTVQLVIVRGTTPETEWQDGSEQE